MTRPRGKPIKVYVTDEELATIEPRAESANISLSAYLRAAGLNLRVHSALDVHAVNELSIVNGQLGRTAAMLQQLVNDERFDVKQVRMLMKEFRELQKQSHEIMGRMMR